MSVKVKNIDFDRVTYNTVDSVVIRDARGKILWEGSSGQSDSFKVAVDENGQEYRYEEFFAGNYVLTIRYGVLKVTQK